MVYISVLTGGTFSILISSHLQGEGLLEDSVKRGESVAKVGVMVDLFWREVEKDLKSEGEVARNFAKEMNRMMMHMREGLKRMNLENDVRQGKNKEF